MPVGYGIGLFGDPKLHALVEVGLVRVLVARDGRETALLLRAPLGGLAVKEAHVNGTVELVDVHRADALLELVVLRPQQGHHIVIVALLVVVARPQCTMPRYTQISPT